VLNRTSNKKCGNRSRANEEIHFPIASMTAEPQSDPVRDFHVWYYGTHRWEQVTFLDVPCLKSVSDLWNYQEILTDLKPSLVVEFGTHRGGSALYFA
jgi:cephalosporin hydroxylase